MSDKEDDSQENAEIRFMLFHDKIATTIMVFVIILALLFARCPLSF